MAELLTAADIMTEGVIAIEGDASVREAAELMRDEDIRSLVVLKEGDAVGILVGRDIVYNVDAVGLDAHETRVSDVMSGDLVTASGRDEVSDIARSMIEHDISRVPILEGNQLVGIVTQSNILQAWPSYIELLREENQIYPAEAATAGESVLMEGECSQCENFSDELVAVDGVFLCPECRAEL